MIVAPDATQIKRAMMSQVNRGNLQQTRQFFTKIKSDGRGVKTRIPKDYIQ